MRAIELCAGGGGQALGVDLAGFETTALFEIEKIACETLQKNRPHWNVINEDLNRVDPRSYKGVDIVCGGVPCQPFSIAGQKLGKFDERDLFPVAINFVKQIRPVGFFFENVRGLAASTFNDYRNQIIKEFVDMGYHTEWKVLEASDFGVPQLRPRFILVGKRNGTSSFPWPNEQYGSRVSVSQSISDLMGINGWRGLKAWQKKAHTVAPTIVGGSKKHGGPDLGPTRAKRQWLELGIDGMGIANEAPAKDFEGNPRLTNGMVARIQGFPDTWQFAGKKTAVYRQLGNAFPPPVAEAVALAMKLWVQESAAKKPRRRTPQLQLDL